MDKRKKIIVFVVIAVIIIAGYYFYTKGKAANAATLPASQDFKKLNLVNASAADEKDEYIFTGPVNAIVTPLKAGVSALSNPKFNIIQKLKNIF